MDKPMTTDARACFSFVVYGLPAPQGSKRHVGNGVMIESSKKVKPWREAVKWAAREATQKHKLDALANCFAHGNGVAMLFPFDGPVVARMVFTMPKPKSAPKKRVTYPATMPDLSKLARSTEDALTDAGIYVDDARIVEYSRLAKVYPNEDPEALEAPGVRITITARGE